MLLLAASLLVAHASPLPVGEDAAAWADAWAHAGLSPGVLNYVALTPTGGQWLVTVTGPDGIRRSARVAAPRTQSDREDLAGLVASLRRAGTSNLPPMPGMPPLPPAPAPAPKPVVAPKPTMLTPAPKSAPKPAPAPKPTTIAPEAAPTPPPPTPVATPEPASPPKSPESTLADFKSPEPALAEPTLAAPKSPEPTLAAPTYVAPKSADPALAAPTLATPTPVSPPPSPRATPARRLPAAPPNGPRVTLTPWARLDATAQLWPGREIGLRSTVAIGLARGAWRLGVEGHGVAPATLDAIGAGGTQTDVGAGLRAGWCPALPGGAGGPTVEVGPTWVHTTFLWNGGPVAMGDIVGADAVLRWALPVGPLFLSPTVGGEVLFATTTVRLGEAGADVLLSPWRGFAGLGVEWRR